MRLFIVFLLFIIVKSKLAEVKDHSIDEITAIYDIKNVSKKKDSNGKGSTTYHYTVAYNNQQYGTCFMKVESKEDDLKFPDTKRYVYSKQCNCCNPTSLKYPKDSDHEVNSYVFPPEFIYSETGKDVLITLFSFSLIPFIHLMFLDKRSAAYSISALVVYLGLSLYLVIIPYTNKYTTKIDFDDSYDKYKLSDIVLSDNSLYGLYSFADKTLEISFCENNNELLECGFIKQYSSLSLYVYYDGDSHETINYGEINETIIGYNTIMLISIIVIFIYLVILMFACK